MPSIAFKRSSRGKLTFDRDPNTGEYRRDESHGYAVLRTVAMDKGAYYFGTASDGTVLGTITTDRMVTGSQLVAAATDGLRQVQQQGLIVARAPTATRIAPGHWAVTLPYRSGGQERTQRLEVG